MRLLVEIFNTGDLRYLLKEYDEEISNTQLMPYFDVIMAEFEDIKGSREYSSYLEKLDDKLWKEYLIRAYLLTARCIEWGMKDDAQLMIREFKLKVKLNHEKAIDRAALGTIERRIKQIKTTLKINEEQDKEEKEQGKNVEWEDMIVSIHTSLDVQIDYDCSVKLYTSYEKSRDALIAAKKKQHG